MLIGSHLDTVRDAGRYDGPLGVVIGLAVAEALRHETLPFALEIAGISDEEACDSDARSWAHGALAGTLDADDLALRDGDGVTLAEAIARFESGGSVEACAITPAELLAYLEVHIEQGPVLEASINRSAWSAASPATWRSYVLEGRAGHAGTTPMGLRRDALAAAAELALVVERLATETPELVATVGISSWRAPAATT
ncbi:MAG: M20/M25/M40 family metallo-hydrolase [Polyangiales bacterium]